MRFLWEGHVARLSRRIESRYGPPVLVMGMHRSGTSLVTRLLRTAGGYFGSKLDPNSESILFLQLNHSLLNCMGQSWYAVPTDFDGAGLVLDDRVWKCLSASRHLLWPEFFETFGEEGVEGHRLLPEEYQLPEGGLKAFIGFSVWPKKRGVASFWGWKDPRTTLTLPIWLRLFPGARVIHVVRNGIDSALSLWRRSLASGEGEPYCTDPHYCFDLWEGYVEQGLRFRSLPEDRYHEVRYEDILQDPALHVRRLTAFVRSSEEGAETLIRLIDRKKSGRHGWDDHPGLLRRARESEPFQRLGYGDLL